ncbi:hypothetical protein FH972_006990 [Carpinus fangiana]|uniref:Kinesin motor domain-containing protein n=1 Tax=Carpinus fangiana TaxID=176857 RepID=A0A5N6QTY1_9ROSI|nr:hypothetical protein FH972_006990 [Carpinus fangiana]
MESKLRDLEEREKKIYKNIMELKGTIRVFCRVRPLLLVDGVGTEGTIISYPTSMEARHRGIDLVQSGQKHSFTFDRVFDDKALQKDVFEEISDLVRNALDGHKVCIFAYGQTGSGKTYTMMGGPKPEDKGLIPHSLEHIFKTSHESEKLGWEYKMQASMLEIYNETIRDLLSTNPSYALDMFWSRGKGHVSAITTVDVCNIEEILSLLQQATRNRFVGSTKMNERSSRSHFVFSLKIFGENKINEQQVQGVLNVIDLAGSQRVSSTLAIGDRLKETQAINRSLSALAAVISALAKKKKHVPYRNSKLTYILEPYLSGDSKVLMFVNISPNPSSGGESLCSLRFAAKVNACEIGIPRVRVDNRRIFYL